MITCLGRQDFYVGDYDYNDGGGEGDGGDDAVDQPLFLWEGLSGGGRGTAGGQGGALHHIWIIVYDIIDNDI